MVTASKGKAVDDAHRPRIDLHEDEAKMGLDYFLARATDPQHAKAVLNCLRFQSVAVFSAMVVKGDDPYAQAVALEAIGGLSFLSSLRHGALLSVRKKIAAGKFEKFIMLNKRRRWTITRETSFS